VRLCSRAETATRFRQFAVEVFEDAFAALAVGLDRELRVEHQDLDERREGLGHALRDRRETPR